MFTLLNVVGITLKLENAFFEKKKTTYFVSYNNCRIFEKKKQSQNIPEIFTHTFAAK